MITAIACLILAFSIVFGVWTLVDGWLERHHARMQDAGLE